MIGYLLPFAALVAGALIVVYWLRRLSALPPARRSQLSPSILLGVAGVILVLLVAADRLDRSPAGYESRQPPLLVAFLVDLSLSMDAVPDPRQHGEMPSRLDRTRRVMLGVLDELESAQTDVLVSIGAFTSHYETLLAWDDNLPQIREAVEYVLAPGLLSQPGSDLGGALKGVLPLFDTLPEQYEDQAGRYLVIVSDGENTVEKTNLPASVAEIRERGIRVVALQAGTPEVPEGLPAYDQTGTFLGFQDVGGEIYTISDSENMKLIAGTGSEEGVHVQAGERRAAQRISNYIGVSARASSANSTVYLLTVLGLWVLSMMVLLWFS